MHAAPYARERFVAWIGFICFTSPWVWTRRRGFIRLLFIGEGVRFLFLKKRNKRRCGGGFLSEKRRFPAHPARNEKTDGSHTNRPFCIARWWERQQRRKKAVPQMIFFCFFSSKKKRRGTISFLEEKKQKTFAAAGDGRRSAHFRTSHLWYKNRAVRMWTARFVLQGCIKRFEKRKNLIRNWLSFASFSF